jgi:hypothetical protein
MVENIKALRRENLELRLLLGSLPDPIPDTNWAPLVSQGWFRNRKRLRELGQTPPPENVA